jgi:hypothetical protein
LYFALGGNNDVDADANANVDVDADVDADDSSWTIATVEDILSEENPVSKH